MNRHGINPRWVVHTLGERGIPALSPDDADRAIASLPSKHAQAFRQLISRLHNGHDQPEDMDKVVAWVRNAKSTEAEMGASEMPAPTAGVSEEVVPAEKGAKVDSALASKAVQEDASEKGEGGSTVRQRPMQVNRQIRQRLSHHVYGKDAAVCVEPAQVEDSTPDNPVPIFHTVLLEMAPNRGDGRFDWESKISVRLTRREMPLFYAVCMGWLDEVEFKNHGPDHDKALVLKDQQTKMFLRLRQGRKGYGVPIPPAELFYVAGLVLKALQSNMPGLDTQAVAMLVRRVAAMHVVQSREEKSESSDHSLAAVSGARSQE